MNRDLRQHLWNCAEILRGSAVDRTDWKAYILPLLFFKRISDVWDEETADAAALFGDADPVDFPEVHRFNVPAGCHWRDVRETPANVGAALSHAMREIERANPDTLYRVFGAADWGNREMLTDEILKDPRCSIGCYIMRMCSSADHAAGAPKSTPTCVPRTGRSKTPPVSAARRNCWFCPSINCCF
jgi:hypothetical protein